MSKLRAKFSTSIIYIGALLLNAAAGNFNNFGIMSPYIASYYYHKDNSIRNSDFTIVTGIAGISESITTLIISYLLKYIKPFYLILSIGTFTCISMILTSLITDPIAFCWVYGISLGSFSSTVFLPSVWILWNYFPQNKAKISGLLLAVYSLGSVPFGLMFTFLANPDDESAHYIEGSSSKDRMFSQDVSQNVPSTIRWTSATYLACVWIGLAFLPRKMKEEVKTDEIPSVNLTFKEMIKSLKFWNLFFLMLLTEAALIYLQTVYKILGIIYINDDHLISYIGIGSFISMCIGRLVYGAMFDKYRTKLIMILTYSCMGLIMLVLWFTLKSSILYGILVIAFNFFGASVYNSLLIQTEKDFPGDKKVISYICLTFIPVYFSAYIFEKWITPHIGYLYSFTIFAIFYLIAIIQLLLHNKIGDSKVTPELSSSGKIEYSSPTEGS